MDESAESIFGSNEGDAWCRPTGAEWAWLDALIGPLDEDFIAAVATRSSDQKRETLDFFK